MSRLSGPVLLDTNIPMYAAGREHPLREPAQRVIRAVVAGDLDAYTDVEVLREILYRYLRTGERDAAFAVFDSFQRLMDGRVLPVEVADMVRARALAAEWANMSPRDYIHWSIMLGHGIRAIVTADRHFDHAEGISRIDPDEVRLR